MEAENYKLIPSYSVDHDGTDPEIVEYQDDSIYIVFLSRFLERVKRAGVFLDLLSRLAASQLRLPLLSRACIASTGVRTYLTVKMMPALQPFDIVFQNNAESTCFCPCIVSPLSSSAQLSFPFFVLVKVLHFVAVVQ